MPGVVETLELLLQSSGADTVVTSLSNVAKSADSEAISALKATDALTTQVAATDKLAASQAKLVLAQAKQDGGGGSGSDEAVAAAAAQKQYAVSKAESAVASDQLAAAELQASAATDGLGAAIAETGSVIGGMLTSLAPLLAAGIVFEGIKSGISDFESLTDQIRQLQMTTGASAGTASLLVGQISAVGGSAGTVATALVKMGASIADGTSKLGDFGIQTAHDAAGNVDLVQTFQNVREAYNDSADAATKDAIAKAISLRAGQALIPLLNESTSAQNELNAATKARGGVFTQSDVDQGLALKEASNQLGEAFNQVKIDLAEGVLPNLIATLHGVTDIIGAVTSLKNDVESLGGPFKNIGKELTMGGPASLAGLFDELTGKTKAQTAAQKDGNDASAGSVTNLTAEATAVTNLSSAVVAEYNAKKSVLAATNDVANATYNETQTQAALAKLVKDGPVDEVALANAKDSLASSTTSLTRALASETDAQAALTKARQGATELDLAEGSQKIVDATSKVADAQAAVAQARQDLDALQGAGTASTADLAVAQGKVTDALNGVTDAQLAQQQAGVDLQTTQAKGTDTDTAVVSAQKSLANAQDSVSSALDAQGKAAAAVRTAAAGDPDFATKLAAAQHTEAAAVAAIATAQDSQMSSAYQLQTATDALNESLSTNAAQIGAVANQLKAFPGYAAILPPSGQTPKPGGTTYPGDPTLASSNQDALNSLLGLTPAPKPLNGARASGGTTEEGNWLVGEHGAEVLHLGAGQKGSISPHSGGATPRPTQHNEITQNFTSGLTAAEAQSELAWTLSNLPQPPR